MILASNKQHKQKHKKNELEGKEKQTQKRTWKTKPRET
jgi:hypothetical protein